MDESQSPLVTSDVAVVRRSRMRLVNALYGLAALTLVLSCPAATIVGGSLQGHVPSQLGMLIAFSTFLVPALLWSLGLRESAGRIVAGGAKVERDGSLALSDDTHTRIDRERIAEGYSMADSAGVVVETRAGVRYQIALPDGQSVKWLEALGLDAGRRLFRGSFHRIFNQIMFWMLGAPTLVGFALWVGLAAAGDNTRAIVPSVVASIVAGLAVSLFASLRWMGSEVVVGADGLTVRDGLFKKFIAYSSIAHVSLVGGELEFTLTDRSTTKCWVDGDVGTNAATLMQRIEEARATFARGGGRNAAAQLARDGRSIAEWREALARLLGRKGGYREVGLDAETLVRVLSDASAPVEHRVAAALALGTDERHKEQVRVVTAALADERVRIALESAAEGRLDDDQYDRAVESAKVRVDAG